MNSETSGDPQSLWAIWNSEPAQVTRRVVEVLREVRPHVVITFNKYGGYGHPDHIAIQRATTEAFHLAGDAHYSTGQPPHQPQKLYYSSIPAAMIRIGIWRMRLKGQNPRQLGRNKDIDMVAILDHVEPIHAKVNIAGYYEIWEAASAAHASQGGGRGGMLPRWVRKLLGSTQGFTRIYPSANGSTNEHDLFEGVRLEAGAPATV
jgi:LmbE family N-acetylglucosaminyl deacetylase